jgi:hypothetical protein
MMISHFFDLFSLFFWITIWLLCLIGWGALIKNIIGINSKLNFSDAWIGLVAGIAFIEAFNFWIPIDWRISLIFLIIGLSIFIKINLAFPLRAPNGKSREEELKQALDKNFEMIIIQGQKDTFGSASDIKKALGTRKNLEIIDAGNLTHKLSGTMGEVVIECLSKKGY